MVKMPSLDDLKKMSADLVESAKQSKLVDKLKSRVESLGASLAKAGTDETPAAEADDALQTEIKAFYATLTEIKESQPELFKKLTSQLKTVVKTIEKTTGKKYDID